MAQNALPYEIDHILKKLEFVSRIPANHKVNIKDMTTQDKHSWLGAFHRYCRNVDRKSTMRDLQDIIDEAARTLRNYEDNKVYVSKIVQALQKTKYAIQRMGNTTYGDDTCIMSDIAVKVDTIDIYLEKYGNENQKTKKIEINTETSVPDLSLSESPLSSSSYSSLDQGD